MKYRISVYKYGISSKAKQRSGNEIRIPAEHQIVRLIIKCAKLRDTPSRAANDWVKNIFYYTYGIAWHRIASDERMRPTSSHKH